uniref:hypothetical protein n=1 Tax=Neorhizobium sp. EC2-8 TaxID=3129230 RepID=UPI003100AE2C
MLQLDCTVVQKAAMHSTATMLWPAAHRASQCFILKKNLPLCRKRGDRRHTARAASLVRSELLKLSAEPTLYLAKPTP